MRRSLFIRNKNTTNRASRYKWVEPVITIKPNSGWADYYVDASRPDDSGDGLTLATAKKTLMAAQALATVTDKKIYVVSGTYSEVSASANGLANPTNSRILSWFFEDGCVVTLDCNAGTSTFCLSGTGTVNIYGYGIFYATNVGAINMFRVNGTGNINLEGRYIETSGLSSALFNQTGSTGTFNVKLIGRASDGVSIDFTNNTYASGAFYCRGGTFHVKNILNNKASGAYPLAHLQGALVTDFYLTAKEISTIESTTGTFFMQNVDQPTYKMIIRAEKINSYSSQANGHLFRLDSSTSTHTHYMKVVGAEIKANSTTGYGVVAFYSPITNLNTFELDNSSIYIKNGNTENIFVQRTTPTTTPNIRLTGNSSVTHFNNQSIFNVIGKRIISNKYWS